MYRFKVRPLCILSTAGMCGLPLIAVVKYALDGSVLKGLFPARPSNSRAHCELPQLVNG